MANAGLKQRWNRNKQKSVELQVTTDNHASRDERARVHDGRIDAVDLLMWFEIGRVSTEHGERMNVRPQHAPVRQAVSTLVTQPFEHVEHVLQVASFQLENTTTTY